MLQCTEPSRWTDRDSQSAPSNDNLHAPRTDHRLQLKETIAELGYSAMVFGQL